MLKRQKTIENIEIIYHYGLDKMRDSGNFILNRADWKMIKKKKSLSTQQETNVHGSNA